MDKDGYNLFIGSSTGLIKGAYVGKNDVNVKVFSKNCVKDKELISNKNEITYLNWDSSLENEILVGMKNGIKTFNVDSEEFTINCSIPDGNIGGFFKNDETLFLALKSGSIKSLKYPFDEENLIEEFNVGKDVEKMKRSITKSNIVAVGGKDNDLKLYDLNTRQTTFIAKNIKPDELQIQAPVWVSDMTFFPDSDKIINCSRHGYVRLYDPLLPQRRPVINVQQPEEVFTCISRTPNDQQVLVGSGYGNLMLVDLRNKNAFAGKYKGFTGAVKSIACPSNQSLVMTASLDRHFRIHDFTTRQLLVKEYMQSRLTTLLPKESFELKKFKSETTSDPEVKKKKKKKVVDELEPDSQNASEIETSSKTAKRKTIDEKAVEEPKKIKWKKTK
ncbi:WD repeat-containing protein 74 [Planococcus citri]|uniref:WD repeat-containing protein 74 n=1 Tax=Planococcus citri TaxID=170843 RepID=UPI0031F7AFE8